MLKVANSAPSVACLLSITRDGSRRILSSPGRNKPHGGSIPRGQASRALGDIGTHAEHLARFITGCTPTEVSAHLTSFVDGRILDDDASVHVRAENNVHVTLTASQICTGEANGLSIRVYGDKAGLVWKQETPETLTLIHNDCSRTTYTRGMGNLSPIATSSTRVPAGHPEGYIEAFANIYRGVCDQINAVRTGAAETDLAGVVPNAHDGYLGIRFVEACVTSSKNNGEWTSL